VGVAASGTTPYTVAAVRAGAAAGALTICIAGNRETPLLRSAAHPILLETGAEAIAGSTRMKAGTAQKIALNLFSTAVMLRLGRVYGGLMVSMRVTNAKLSSRAIQMIRDISGVDRQTAEAAFEKADGEVKLAALIARGVTPEQGSALLSAAGGNLRIALGQAGGRPGLP
jgi:N-acetylmuramic acid 6-phosphate etherase